MNDVQCPGCGLILPQVPSEAPPGYHASGACYAWYGELTAYTLGRQDRAFIHQHAVDAYAAQHAGAATKPITVAFALIGLYLAVERGYDGRAVQRRHMLIARHKHPWPAPEPPDRACYSVTVGDVLAAPPGERRDAALLGWMRDVWGCWGHQHAWVREACRVLLGVAVPPRA